MLRFVMRWTWNPSTLHSRICNFCSLEGIGWISYPRPTTLSTPVRLKFLLFLPFNSCPTMLLLFSSLFRTFSWKRLTSLIEVWRKFKFPSGINCEEVTLPRFVSLCSDNTRKHSFLTPIEASCYTGYASSREQLIAYPNIFTKCV